MVFGCVLWVGALGDSGYGHGGVLGFAVFGSPAGVFGPAAAAIGLPIVWWALGFAIAQHRRRLALCLLSLHALAIPFAVFNALHRSLAIELDLKRQMFNLNPVAMSLIWSLYAGGYVLAWIVVRRLRSVRS